MRRKNKEINIFSMSALDLFASALGAFILIAVVALPYYLNTDKKLMQDVQMLKEQNRSLQEELSMCKLETGRLKQKVSLLDTQNQRLQSENDSLKDSLNDCQKKVFIAVIMQWYEKNDIDLHVVTPEGNEYYYSKNNRNGTDFPGSSAKLSRDTQNGPGVEVWEMPVAGPGKYKIYYNYYSSAGTATKVTGMVYTNKGSHQINDTTLKPKQKRLVQTVIVGVDGSVRYE